MGKSNLIWPGVISVTNPWFRIHSELLNDPKVQQLDGETFKIWVNLLCATNDAVASTLQSVACPFLLRIPEETFATAYATLHDAGLLIEVDGGFQPKGWKKRQFLSDNSTERSRKHREKKRKDEQGGNGDGNVPGNVAETPPDSDADTDSDTEKEPPVIPQGDDHDLYEKPKVKRATQIADGFPDATAMKAATKYWRDQGRSDLNARTEAAAFRDNKLQNGKTHKDWKAAWRTWLRNAIKYNPPPKNGFNGQSVSHGTIDASPEDWMRRAKMFREKGMWSSEWGPKPDEAGCGAPPDILLKFTEQRTML